MARGNRSTQEPRTIPDDLVPLSRWGSEQRQRGTGSTPGVPVPMASTTGPVLRSRPVRADVLRAAGFIEEIVEEEGSADTIRAPLLSIQGTESGNTVSAQPATGIGNTVSSTEPSPAAALPASATAVPLERVKHARETHCVCGEELKGRVRTFACGHSLHDHCHQYYWQTYYKDMMEWTEKKVGLYEKRLEKVVSENGQGIISIDGDANAFAHSLSGLDYVKPGKPCCPFCRKETGPQDGIVRENYLNHALAAEKRKKLSEAEREKKRRKNEARDARRKKRARN